MKICAIIFFISSLFCFSHLNSQSLNLGIPIIRNYDKKQYRAGTQTWEIQQDQSGLIYFANNDGLLVFDGASWQTYTLPNQTIARSICLHQNKLMAGGQDEIGFFRPDSSGTLHFQSLKTLLPKEDKQLTDIWDIESFDQSLFFRTTEKVFRLAEDRISTLLTLSDITFMGTAEGILWVYDRESGFFQWRNSQFRPFTREGIPPHSNISGVIAHPRGYLAMTVKNGLFLYENGKWQAFGEQSLNTFASQNLAYSLIKLQGNKFAIGTTLLGILIFDEAGRPLFHLHKKNGLQDNHCIILYQDLSNDLWIGQNHGIDRVNIQEPYQLVYPDEEKQGTAYSAAVSDQYIFLGTSEGLYKAPRKNWYSPFQKPYFEMVKGTEGQVWGLRQLGSTLLMGHHEGSFYWDGNQMVHIKGHMGSWDFISVQNHPDLLMAGTYEGLALYRKEGNTINYLRHLKGLEESCRFLIQDVKGQIWMAHPYRGIFQIDLSPDLDSVSYRILGPDHGLPSAFRNFVFQIHGELVFGTERGIYRYDYEEGRFFPHDTFNSLLGETTTILRLVESPTGDIWYVTPEECGYLMLDKVGIEKTWTRKILKGIANDLVGGHEFVNPYSDKQAILGLEKGFIFYNYLSDESTHSFPVHLAKVEISGHHRQTLFAGMVVNDPKTEFYCQKDLKPSANNLRFYFSSPQKLSLVNSKYQYYLEGLEKSWCLPTEKNEKEYTHLPSGKYTFHLKRADGSSDQSGELLYHFTISPPWYAGSLAISFYFLVSIGFILSLIWFPRKRYQREKALLKSAQQKNEEVHLQQLAEKEKDLSRLNNEKLEAEINFKNKELASKTMHLVQKSELLLKLGEELKKIEQKAGEPEVRSGIRGLIHLLQHNHQLDEDWEQFAFHFDQVHRDFLQRLHESYPQLTPKDQKLCAYLRMNLSTKEIAPLMNISVRGVEISRYRLRKKLNLAKEINLNEFMMDF